VSADRLAAAVVLLLSAPTASLGAATTVYSGGTVHPISGPPIENGMLVVEDGHIVAVGPSAPPAQAAGVVDMHGKHIYPGFVHPLSALGLVEVGSVRGTVDTREVGDLNPDLRVERAFHADSELLPVAMSGGVLTALVAPQGGLVRGRSAVMRLAGWNWEEMTLAAPAAMHLSLPRFQPRNGDAGSEERERVASEKREALRLIDELFGAAAGYRRAVEAGERGEAERPVHRPDLEALLPVLSGELPLFIHAREHSQIEHALDWAKEQGLPRFVLVGGADLARHAERLAREQVPVVLDGVLDLPPRRWEPYDTAFTAAARLHRAGVRFCIGDGGGAANARNLPFEAAMAAAFGLPRDEALRSVTLSAAEILGAADHVGSLEPGKEATFIVTDGDPLEILTTIERVFVRGREIDPSGDRQRRLYERYRARPTPDQ
jgi:imidazolonepropionase-like amidohydrolase